MARFCSKNFWAILSKAKLKIWLIIALIFLFLPENIFSETGLIISKIDVKGEFMEITNRGENLSLENYYLVYWSKNRSLDNPWRVKKFPEGSFLKNEESMVIGFKTNDSLSFDWQVYQGGLLSDNDGALAIYSGNPSEIGFENFLDLCWWGEPIVKNGREINNKSLNIQKTTDENVKTEEQNIFLEIKEPKEFLELTEGAKVIYEAQVIVEPGILGKQIFYLDGVEVYSFNKDFPEIKTGDLIKVKGEMSFPYGQPRIKTKSRDDIEILNSTLPPLLPLNISLEDIQKITPSKLVKIQGQAIERTNDNLYILENNKEILVDLGKVEGINKQEIKEKDFLEITGVLVSKNNEIKILPRYAEDIADFKQNEEEETIVEENKIKNNNLDFSSSDNSSFRPSYLLISFTALGSILAVLLIVQKRGQRPFSKD